MSDKLGLAITDLLKRDFVKPPYTLTEAPDQEKAECKDLVLVKHQEVGSAIATIYVDCARDRNTAMYLMVACNNFQDIRRQRDLYLQQRNLLMEAAEMVRSQTSGATAGAGSILISAKSYNFTAVTIDEIKKEDGE